MSGAMLSGIYLINQKGEVLIYRLFRDDVGKGVPEVFRLNVIGAKEVRSPIRTIGGTVYMHCRVDNVYLLIVTQGNVNASLVFEVLYRLAAVCRSQFGGRFNEEAIRNNYILIYEVIDEMLDYGYPQLTGEEALKLYLTQTGTFKSSLGDEGSKKALQQVTGAIPWRSPDIRYRKNEIFIDVIESVNLLMSTQGNTLRADVTGEIRMKCFLSGMPECRFGINDKLLLEKEGKGGSASSAPSSSRSGNKKGAGAIELDDCTFHQCVKLGKFDSDRMITFIPPDGEFQLLKYRTTEHINIPFKVTPVINEVGKTRLEYKVIVRSNFHSKMFGNDVFIAIPTPKSTAVCKVKVNGGRAKYQPSVDAIVWRIKRFPGMAEATLSAEVELLATISGDKKAWSRPPISMQFQVPMFTASGLHVRFLKVVEPKMHYQTVKWVRYMTKAGTYQIRI